MSVSVEQMDPDVRGAGPSDDASGATGGSMDVAQVLQTTADVDDAAVFTAWLAGVETHGAGSEAAGVYLSYVPMGASARGSGPVQLKWVTVGSRGSLLLEADREAALLIESTIVSHRFGRPLRFWVSVRDSLLGCSNVIRGIQRQRSAGGDSSIHRAEQVRLLQAALAGALLIHDEISSAEPADAHRASVLAIRIADSTRS